ncbi:MAG: DUF5696 domain-containing protein [Armatimonadota bacterium]
MKPIDYLASSHITVVQKGAFWNIDSPRTHVKLNIDTLAITLSTRNATWEIPQSSENDLLLRTAQKSDIKVALKSAKSKQITPYQTGCINGVKISLSGFGDNNLSLDLFLTIEWPTEDVICTTTCIEGNSTMRELRWPMGLTAGSADAAIVPLMQGAKIPKDWPTKVWAFDTLTHSRALYMPWWGFESGKSAMMQILETPDDAGFELSHPAGGPTFIVQKWLPQLGKFGYPRTMRIKLFDTGNYVQMAKAYRQHVIDRGNFVSLKQKIARTPSLQQIIGAPVIHTSSAVHQEPGSNAYNKENDAANHAFTPWEDTGKAFEKLHSKGVKRAYVHLDGWGFRGYDNQHPDVVPPSPECGGWQGLKQLSLTCEKLNYLFAIHDQYRDYYELAASYNPKHVVINEDGSYYDDGFWCGGKQSFLCPSLAPAYVMRNHQALLTNGVKVKGAYLDVFSVLPPDECFSPEHPVTRTECLKYRAQCFNYVQSRLGVISSEEPSDWSVPYLHLVHHGPFSLDPYFYDGPAMGITIPLFNLVYHDALITPWFPYTHKGGGFGIPNTDQGMSHAVLNAAMPYIDLNASAEEITRVKMLCALQTRLVHAEMTEHTLLDVKGRSQRSTWSDGTVITVDLGSGKYDVKPAITSSELNKAMV